MSENIENNNIENSNSSTVKKEKEKKGWKRELFEWIVTLGAAVIIAFAVKALIFEPVKVQGRSMMNTLQDGEIMIVTKYDYILGEPERFDIITCRYPKRSEFFVKRIVGIPGDTVSVSNGYLTVNGITYAEDYLDFRPNYSFDDYVVPEGEYFVLGDNRSNSNDSHIIGSITRKQVLGHVRQVVFPFNAWRNVELKEDEIKTISVN
ncbi:MAG: signal peptidase I [Christensenellaceae bacterium]|nr:signal peptidase I [Christensenellaceae bacterium]